MPVEFNGGFLMMRLDGCKVNPRFSAGRQQAVKYTALFLDEQNPLMALPIPAGWERHAHHCTLKYYSQRQRPLLKKSSDIPAALLPNITSGQLKVTRLRMTDKVFYAVVEPPAAVTQWVKAHGLPMPPWHVTIAAAPGIKPIEAFDVESALITKRGSILLAQDQVVTMTLNFKTGMCLADDQLIFPV